MQPEIAALLASRQQRLCSLLPDCGVCADLASMLGTLVLTLCVVCCLSLKHADSSTREQCPTLIILPNSEEKPETQAPPMSSILLAYLVPRFVAQLGQLAHACRPAAHRRWVLRPCAAWPRAPAPIAAPKRLLLPSLPSALLQTHNPSPCTCLVPFPHIVLAGSPRFIPLRRRPCVPLGPPCTLAT